VEVDFGKGEKAMINMIQHFFAGMGAKNCLFGRRRKRSNFGGDQRREEIYNFVN